MNVIFALDPFVVTSIIPRLPDIIWSPVQHQQPGDTLGPRVRHHRLQELVDSDLGALAEDQVPAVLLHVERVPLPHSRRKLHDVFKIICEPEEIIYQKTCSL